MGVAAELARRLAAEAEAVCRHYLPAGRRAGRYWMIGDAQGAPGRSLHVRLAGPAHGRCAAGKWTDEATGEHGDLLDLIALNQGLRAPADIFDEARRFLRVPRSPDPVSKPPAPTGSPEAARRLWALARPLGHSLADRYLRGRGIDFGSQCLSLRFHPSCWYRGEADDPLDRVRDAWPALIAAVTDGHGAVTGLHRTWLSLDGTSKAPISTPRRAMGHLLGRAVRFGQPGPVMAAGEGIETMLSLRAVLPALPLAACLSANHLAAFEPPTTLERLYLVRDRDPAGHWATAALGDRATSLGIQAITLDSELDDMNADLVQLGEAALRRTLLAQLAAADRLALGA